MSQVLSGLPDAGPTRVDRWLAVVILVAAAVLRLWGITTSEVLTDEGNYAMRAIGWNDFHFSTTLQTPWVWYVNETLPWWTQLSFADHPPLHFATLWLSTHLFGVNLFAVRLPSVLFSLGAVALVMAIGRRLGWGRASLIAGAFLAFLPWHVYIGRQAIQESGVMFWLLLGLWLWLQSRSTSWRGPLLAGLAFGAAMLMKYSGIIWLPLWLLLAWRAPRMRWWVTPLVAITLLTPVIVYNQHLYDSRGHYDLQIARFLGQDTKTDWPASSQGLWQGKLSNASTFILRQVQGVSLPVALGVVGLLAVALRRRGREWMRDPGFWVSIGMSAIVAGLALATLDDYGRGSIVLPFYALTLGFTAALVPLQRQPFVGVAISLLLVSASIGDRLGAVFVPQPVLATFADELKPRGYLAWEQWRMANLPTRLAPRHYPSLQAYLYEVAANVANPDRPLVVFDQRLSWFQMNWYFYRDALYAQDATFVPANFFWLLFQQGLIEQMPPRELIFVQMDAASQDTKPLHDEFSRVTEQVMQQLASQQHAVPETVLTADGAPLVRVWHLRFDLAALRPTPSSP